MNYKYARIMPNMWNFLVCFLVIFLNVENDIFVFANLSGKTHKIGGEKMQEGRIKAFDDLLIMYGKQINDARDLGPAIKEAKRLSQNSQYPSDLAAYYVDVLELLEKEGNAKVIYKEHDRLNAILTAASTKRDGQAEIEEAKLRKNILGAFTDSAAEYFLKEMNAMRDVNFINVNQPPDSFHQHQRPDNMRTKMQKTHEEM